MKLSEIANPQHYEIKQWLDKMKIKNYTIGSNTNIVDIKGNVDIFFRNVSSIPIQFGTVVGYFDCSNTQISSLQGMPSVIGGFFSCIGTKITSLSGIDKIIKRIDGRFYCNRNVTHILGLLLIPGITRISIDSGGPIDKIMNAHLKDQDIVTAQDELIDAGFKEQAKL